ncbi:MAG: Two-component transcriptional response regulator, LuxR family [uncultured Nocardioides sp.]|uniref:Two-component transcriptional response regulator, LuxR family n=1 Tax=uncultured Nocardioides sp. TaxID=198441 RepID=A0A6J4MXK9_9ACTN|nr:MAG: Two-component transcriptional response regulator, LuxR family [uncultured Nocardioides sp.]
MTDSTSPFPRPLRVVLHDDSELVGRGLEHMLAPYSDVVVLLPPAGPGRPVPPCELELYDPHGPKAAALDGSAPRPHGRMVAFSWNCTRDAVSTELARGAAGYISKRAPAERLVRGLVQVARGRVVVELAGPRSQTASRHAPAADWPLTDRETAVLALIAQGRSNQEIAEDLSLSINSIKSYIRVAYRKIDVASRSQAVLWGVRHGLLSVHPTGTQGTAPAP